MEVDNRSFFELKEEQQRNKTKNPRSLVPFTWMVHFYFQNNFPKLMFSSQMKNKNNLSQTCFWNKHRFFSGYFELVLSILFCFPESFKTSFQNEKTQRSGCL